MHTLTNLKVEVTNVTKWLSDELAGVRTGRATPNLLDSVKVDAYGSKMPLSQVANIGTEDPRTLRVVPFDVGLAKDVEKAITAANLGVGTASDGKTIRVTFPMLTAERREQLVRLAKQKLEEARVSLRGHRDEVWSTLQSQEKEGLISEDVKFKGKDDMQKIIDDGNKALEDVFKKKEDEIMTQ